MVKITMIIYKLSTHRSIYIPTQKKEKKDNKRFFTFIYDVTYLPNNTEILTLLFFRASIIVSEFTHPGNFHLIPYRLIQYTYPTFYNQYILKHDDFFP